MARPQRGDVSLVLFPYDDSDNAKPRPALVIREDGQDEYLVCQITGTNRSATHQGIWVELNSPEGKQMGIRKDSFINAERFIIIDKWAFYGNQPLGTCPYIDRIEEITDELEG